ncbi:MAG: M20/M25/M40 family metallo-hydrolase [Anaerolineales bacterium]|nr:M20/M25/M40 family metallo-hydrolase [Anaerolineales bacterium]
MIDLSIRVLDLTMQIQQIPGPTFKEEQRGIFVRDLFHKESLKDVSIDDLGNVFARLPGKNKNAKPLIVSAHLDTVFPDSVNLQSREEAGKVIAPGIGDNSLGVGALFGIFWALHQRKTELEHDLWLVANVGEEGLGDLRGMRAVVDRFGADVIGYLVLEGLALGHVYHRAIGVKRYRIHANTAGGHSWSDYGQPSAVHELASLVTKLTSMKLPRTPRTTMNVGTISGGTGINVLASEAKCELDLRSEDPITLEKIVRQVEDVIHSTNRDGVKITTEVIGQRPAGEISSDHPFVQTAVQCMKRQGLEAVLTFGSTDANIPLSRGIPAVVMGITTGGSAHTTHEYIKTEPIAMGMEGVVSFVENIAVKCGNP